MRRVIIVLLIVFGLTAYGFGQKTTQQTENKADQVLHSKGRINPSTLGMEMDIPLAAYPGRGVNLPVSLSYSSKLWHLKQMKKRGPGGEQPCHAYTFPVFGENSASGWTTSVARPQIEYTGQDNVFETNGNPIPRDVICGQSTTAQYGNYVKRIQIQLPSGGSHELRASDTPIQWDRTNVNDTSNPSITSNWYDTYYAVDGSGYKYVESAISARLWMPDGSYYDFGAREAHSGNSFDSLQVRRATGFGDRNGNTMSYRNDNTTTYPNGYWRDTLGRDIAIPMGLSVPASAGVTDYYVPGLSGDLHYKFNWKLLDSALTVTTSTLKYSGDHPESSSATTPSLFTSGIESGGYVYIEPSDGKGITPTALFDPLVLSEIELPNGAKYKFTYNIYGEIDSIQYPTGGAEGFTYSLVEPLGDTEGTYKQTNRGVTEQRIFGEAGDATPLSTWSYGVNASATNYGTPYSVYTVAPDGTRNERFLYRSPSNTLEAHGTWGYDWILAGMKYEDRQFSSAGVLLTRSLSGWDKTVSWSQTYSDGTIEAHRNPRTVSTESIIYDSTGAGLSTKSTIEYDGNLTVIDTPLNVNKTTSYAYAVVSGGNSITPNSAPAASPTAGMTLTATRINETVFLYSTNYSSRNLRSLPVETRVKDASGNIQAKSQIVYDESTSYPILSDGTNAQWTDPNTNYRANRTTTRSWYDLTNNLYVETHAQYDNFGNLRKAWDGRGGLSETEYSGTYQFAFPTKVTTPIPDQGGGGKGSTTAFTSSTAFDLTTGLPTSSTDANGQTTTIEYIDPLLRPTKTTAPNGQQTVTQYGAGIDATTRFIKVKTQLDETNWKQAYKWFDGLGRTIRTQSVETTGDVSVLTCYDNMGRVLKATNPFRGYTNQDCSTTTGLDWTTNTFDTAGRPWQVTTPDNAVAETTFGLATAGANIGTVVTVTDQALKQRRSITNALGQLTRVDEPDTDPSRSSNPLGPVSSPNQPTVYGYDTLNNFVSVQQNGTTAFQCTGTTYGNPTSCTQSRSFNYDSLSRLKSGANPESGTINYTYDLNSNLATKTDARGVVTTYTYDALNRITNRAYTAPSPAPANYQTTPNVDYYYDNITNAKGKLIKVSNSVSTTEYTSFDILGRVTGSKQTTDGVIYGENDPANGKYPMTYSYNLSGALIEQQYPSGRVVKNVLDNNGDLATVKSKKVTASPYLNYASNFTYNASGAVTSIELGNLNWEKTVFNSRLQPTQIGSGKTQGTTDLLKLDYSYGGWSGGSIDATKNNGNVVQQVITVPTVGTYTGFTATQKYYYDSLNRLDDSSEVIGSTTTWRQDFTFDRYGNRNFNRTNTSMPSSFADPAVSDPTISTSKNQITSSGYSYDSSGNTTFDASLRKFIYDAENKQTKVESTNSGQLVTGTIGEYSYDGDGKRVKKTAGTEVTIFVYDDAGKQIAEYSTTVANSTGAQVNYLTNDHLGSPRINTDRDGQVIARHDYHPFGEEVSTSQRSVRPDYSRDAIRKQFTGYERDGETELDFARARMYAKAIGRFSVTDPENCGADSSVPQSWNGYAYVINNPLNFTDPTGLIYLRNPKGGIEWVPDADKNNPRYNGWEVVPYGTEVTPGNKAEGPFRRFIGKRIVLRPDKDGKPNFDLAEAPADDYPLQRFFYGAENRTLRFWRTPIYLAGTAVVLLPAATPFAFAATGSAVGGGLLGIGLSSSEVPTGLALAPSLIQTALSRGTLNPNIYAQLEQQLVRNGGGSILTALNSATLSLGAHLAKVDGLQYKSQVEGTIQNVSNQIVTILQFIKDKGL